MKPPTTEISTKASEIMDTTEWRIRTSGYNGFSFREIAADDDENLQPMHLMTALLAAQFLLRKDSPDWRTIRSEIKEIVCGEPY